MSQLPRFVSSRTGIVPKQSIRWFVKTRTTAGKYIALLSAAQPPRFVSSQTGILSQQRTCWFVKTRTTAGKYIALLFALCFLFSVLSSCNSPFVPKPRGYFAIQFPPHQYQLFNQPGYPYQFEYPVYATILKDSTFFENKAENPWWINVDFPQFNGRIYISYKELAKNKFDKMVDDAFKLTYKHTTKATSIKDSLINTPNGVHGVFFSVGGNAATGKQFFVTDSIHHFLRGALYFDTTPEADSINIVYDFLQTDLLHLINSFEWKTQ